MNDNDNDHDHELHMHILMDSIIIIDNMNKNMK